MLFSEDSDGARYFVVARGTPPDPSDPESKGVRSAYLTFDDADDAQRAEYLSALNKAQASNKGAHLDDEHKLAVAKVTAKFVRDRIKSAHGFEVKEPDGSVRELVWPADADRILGLLKPGLLNLLKNTIDKLNFPNNIDVFENAALVGSSKRPNF